MSNKNDTPLSSAGMDGSEVKNLSERKLVEEHIQALTYAQSGRLSIDGLSRMTCTRGARGVRMCEAYDDLENIGALHTDYETGDVSLTLTGVTILRAHDAEKEPPSEVLGRIERQNNWLR